MHRILVLLTPIFLLVSCHSGADKPPVDARKYHLRFNPPDSSVYRYNTTNETIMAAVGHDTTFGVQRTSRFTVNYLISNDSNEFLMEMTFPGIEYREWQGPRVREIYASDKSGPVKALGNVLKADTLYARIRKADQGITAGGAIELVNSVVDSYYAETDRQEASKYWGRWIEQEMLWKNLDPFMWVDLDSARRTGEHWTTVSTNAEDINFKINKRFHFDSVHSGIATFRSWGWVTNDSAGTWLLGRSVTGELTGTEEGRYLINMATGMPVELSESISAEGEVQMDGGKTRIKFVKTIKMVGGKVK